MKSFPLSGLAYLFAFLITIATLMTLFRVDNFWLDLFQHFKFQYLISSLALGSVGLYFKHRQLSIVMLICCLVNLTFIAPWVLPSSTTISALEAKQTLKVFHANLKTNNRRYELLTAEIRIQKPDIILLQEVDVVWKNQLKLLKNSYPFSKIESRPDNFGIAIYSKLPLNEAKVKYWGKANVPSLLVNFQWENEIVTLAYSHPLPPISQAYYALRNEQLRLMASELSMIKAPLIVAGDFNISMWSYAYQYFESLQLSKAFSLSLGFYSNQADLSLADISDKNLVSIDLGVTFREIQAQLIPGVGSPIFHAANWQMAIDYTIEFGGIALLPASLTKRNKKLFKLSDSPTIEREVYLCFAKEILKDEAKQPYIQWMNKLAEAQFNFKVVTNGK